MHSLTRSPPALASDASREVPIIWFLNNPHIRLIRQAEVADCGLACLAMIANFHGADTDLTTLRRHFKPSSRGIMLRELLGIASELNLVARPVKLVVSQLESLRGPAILHWDMNHFVVLERCEDGKALIHNPGGWSNWMHFPDIEKHLTGVAIQFEPNGVFNPEGMKRRVSESQLKKHTVIPRNAILQIVVLSVLMQLYVLALPYYIQFSADTVLHSGETNQLSIFALGLALFALINAGAKFLRSSVILSVGTVWGSNLYSGIVRKLFRLPLDWFERRHADSILARVKSIEHIKATFIKSTTIAMIDGLLALTTLLVMFFYSAKIAFISLVFVLLYGAIRAAFAAHERNALERLVTASEKEYITLSEALKNISSVRTFSGGLSNFFGWEAQMTDASNADIRARKLAIWRSSVGSAIFGVETVIVVWLAILLFGENNFSAGMVFSFLLYKLHFTEKSQSLIDQFFVLLRLRQSLEQLSDILHAQEDDRIAARDDTSTALKGKIEIRNLEYSHAPTAPAIFSDINLSIEKGQHFAITGPVGSGKSTLLQIMIGLIEPESGQVLIDGMALADIGHSSFHDQIAVVFQEDRLFSCTIAENIALFDKEPDMTRIIKLCYSIGLHKDVESMPMHYETIVGEQGASLSAGQKQKVLLARALYRAPKILFLDEATVFLDDETEKKIINVIKSMGMTLVTVTKRNALIGTADRVFFLTEGKLFDA